MMRPTSNLVRRGIEVLELILTLPILVLIAIAAIQFGVLLMAQNTIATASREAARLAANGSGEWQLEHDVNSCLSPFGLELGDGVRLVIQDETGTLQSLGDGALSSDVLLSPVPHAMIRSTLLVSVESTRTPNLLANHGVDYSNGQFEYSALRFRANRDWE